MRRVLLLIAAVSLLVWATSSMASWRDMRQRCHGDPDEFESTRVHDDARVRRTALESAHDWAPEIGVRKEPGRIYEVRKESHISIDFSGRGFFLEK
jgi:hypothetical protein